MSGKRIGASLQAFYDPFQTQILEGAAFSRKPTLRARFYGMGGVASGHGEGR